MSWAGKILRVDLTKGTVQVRTPQHGLGAGLYRLARAGIQIPGGRSGPQSRSAVARQQADLVDRAADRHHGFDRRPLHRGHQGSAHRRHRLLQLGRLFRRRAEDGGLGHGHLRGQVAQAGVPVRQRRRGRTARCVRACGARPSGRPRRCSRRRCRTRWCASPASAGPARTRCSTHPSSTTCTARRAAPAWAPWPAART